MENFDDFSFVANEFSNGFGDFDSFPPLWFKIIFGAVFLLIAGTILYSIISRAKDRSKPVIPVRAKVVEKRTDVHGHDHSWTTYYATFELENGTRMELELPDNKAGFIIKGDEGILSFQGKLFVSFQVQQKAFNAEKDIWNQ